MLQYLNAFLYGIIQGATEFLPVSSSGHLLIMHRLMPLPLDELSFDVVLHFATLAAIVYYFRGDIIVLIKDWFNSFKGKKTEMSRLGWLIILNTIPAGLAALLFGDLVEEKLRSPLVTGFMLVLVGIMLIVCERIRRDKIELSGLSWPKSLYIGFAQAMALIPGTSRSGITIIAGLQTGLDREAAARFSFLLSIPIVALAALKEIPEFISRPQVGQEYGLLAVAFLAAAISGFLAIKYFLRFVRKYRLDAFGYYRIVIGLLVMIYFLR